MKTFMLLILLTLGLTQISHSQCDTNYRITPVVANYWAQGDWFNDNLLVTCKVGEIVCGYTRIFKNGKMLIHVVGDDWTTSYKDGARYGDTIRFYSELIYLCGEIETITPIVFNPWRSTRVYFRFLGDLDANFKVDIVDLRLLQDYIFSGSQIKDSIVADLNGDCSIDVFDLIIIANYLADKSWGLGQLNYCMGR